MNHPELWDSDASRRLLTSTSANTTVSFSWRTDEDDGDDNRGSKVPSRPRISPPSLSGGVALPVPV